MNANTENKRRRTAAGSGLRRLAAALVLLGLLGGCAELGADDPAARETPAAAQSLREDPAEAADAQTETPAPYENFAVFDLDLAAGSMTAEITYAHSDRLEGGFLLGRGFTVTDILCDGAALDPAALGDSFAFEGYYPLNRYELPAFRESLFIRYTGQIDGSVRYTTYSRESLSEAFAMLRWESFCYPLFGESLYDLFDYLDPDAPLRAEITVRVPAGYTAATPYPQTGQQPDGDALLQVFDGDIAGLHIAVARYQIVELPTGAYYFLPGADPAEMERLISPVMEAADAFLRERFGEAEIPPTMRYIAIPEGYGGYALNGRAVFLDESAFASEHSLHELVHEYIHLGWNPRTEERAVSRSRFFDEGFTCYFEARVMGHLWGEASYRAEIERCRQSLISRFAQGQYELVPITEYGPREYGDLSYNVGPLFFDAMAELVGTDALDEATRQFLGKYRESPVDFERFAGEYLALLDHPELEAFFEEWLYSTEGIARALENR